MPFHIKDQRWVLIQNGLHETEDVLRTSDAVHFQIPGRVLQRFSRACGIPEAWQWNDLAVFAFGVSFRTTVVEGKWCKWEQE